MFHKTTALKNKIADKVKSPIRKVKNFFEENKRRNDEAAAIMDKKYPSGWAQSATNMTELGQIRKGLKKK